MAGTAEGFGPSYISSHSADVILSDIRPTKLQIDALRSVNVLLDEFLYNILSTCRSLSTDKLRAGLLKVLPTSLGKEALLEAEVELRAYWDRTNPAGSSYANGDDQGKTFHLQWAFELLRLKCEAYSTLNESDEDPEAENRLQSRMSQSTGLSPPKAALVAPAALYLTAILESVIFPLPHDHDVVLNNLIRRALCEHILSNVGRVAARDSSKTLATVEDLFVALCEDDSIYGLFKSMKVYEQIEALSVLPKPRRSKSLSRNNDRPNISQRESTPKETQGTATPPRSRMSSDSSVALTAATIPPAHNRRSSLDKARAMKMFMANNRASLDPDGGDGQDGHKKSDSVLSEAYSMYDGSEKSFEDAALLQEFDNLMRSDSTLKVSLTPDRLKTMDVFNKEKGQRGARRPLPKVDLSASEIGSPVMSSVPPSRVNGRSPPNVDSIVEDEEEANIVKQPQPPATRSRQASVTSATSSGTRLRSISASSPLTNHNVTIQPTRSNGSPFPTPPYSSISAQKLPNPTNSPSSFPSPARTRRIAHNRESLDLDDVMAGSDNEEQEVKKVPETPPKRPRPIAYAVSPSTRDLMDFLDQGPPDEPVVSTPPIAKSGRHLLEALAEGSTDARKGNASRSSLQTTNSKGSGRFQRMMAKLSMGSSSEKLRNNGSGDDISKTPSTRVRPPNPSTPTRPSLPFKRSVGNLSIANKPIPPRPPPPISPPSSPSQESLDISVLHASLATRTLATHKVATWEVKPAVAKTQISTPTKRDSHSGPVLVDTPPPANGHSSHIPAQEAMAATKPPSTTTTGVDSPILPISIVEPTFKRPSTKLVAETTQKPSPPQLLADDALAMHRLFSKATTADECRLIFDMFLARSGLSAADYEIPYPSPSPSDLPQTPPSAADVQLEHSLVELLLGDSYTIPPRKRRRKPVPALENLSSESINAPGSG